jgi:hypothetical protein
MSTAAVFFDIEEAFGTTWHPGLLHKEAELSFSCSLNLLAHSFPTENSELRLRANCPLLEMYKQGCHKVPS